MTILESFHSSRYRTFKHYYTAYVVPHLWPYFPTLVSYTRLVQLMPRALVIWYCDLHIRTGQWTEIAFIDTTPLVVCHNRRLAAHQVCAGWAARGKTSMSWLYGFNLHLIVNDAGELLAFCRTLGQGADRQPVPALTTQLFGSLFGDRGCISQALHNLLLAWGLARLTKIRKDTKIRLMCLWDTLMLRKRALIETINDP
jgi:hypothetical protein